MAVGSKELASAQLDGFDSANDQVLILAAFLECLSFASYVILFGECSPARLPWGGVTAT